MCHLLKISLSYPFLQVDRYQESQTPFFKLRQLLLGAPVFPAVSTIKVKVSHMPRMSNDSVHMWCQVVLGWPWGIGSDESHSHVMRAHDATWVSGTWFKVLVANITYALQTSVSSSGNGDRATVNNTPHITELRDNPVGLYMYDVFTTAEISLLVCLVHA